VWLWFLLLLLINDRSLRTEYQVLPTMDQCVLVVTDTCTTVPEWYIKNTTILLDV